MFVDAEIDLARCASHKIMFVFQNSRRVLKSDAALKSGRNQGAECRSLILHAGSVWNAGILVVVPEVATSGAHHYICAEWEVQA